MSQETKMRDDITRLAKSMYDRGLTFGSSGNISARIEDGWLMTPTGSTMGNLNPAKISKLDNEGNLISGDPPTKETFLHIAMYEERPQTGAVVHLHSTHSVAVSCLHDINPKNVLPPITAYYVMKIGTLPLVPYFPPGDLNLARAVREMASDHHAVLLANHGPVVAGKSLEDAVYATEELEETAKLFLMLKDVKTRFLTDEQVAALQEKFAN
ncbi:MAG: aldolase [Rhodospirillaceae bacterium]|nr:aldolase [Rhodospirillaceae bacterium]|tara:strand:+ start:246 stop:881 length:636 start_codon:yes stop_codon:yes gene_type:complete